MFKYRIFICHDNRQKRGACYSPRAQNRTSTQCVGAFIASIVFETLGQEDKSPAVTRVRGEIKRRTYVYKFCFRFASSVRSHLYLGSTAIIAPTTLRKGETGEKRKTRAEERDVPVAGFKSLTVCRPISTVSLPLPVPKQPFTEIPSKAFDTFRVCLVRTTRFLKLCDDLIRSRTLVRSFDSYLDCAD